MPNQAHDSTYTKYSLPPMRELPGRFDIDVKSVFGAYLTKSRKRVLVVLFVYHRNGATEDDGYGSYVYRWNGKGLCIANDLSKKSSGLKNAAEIRGLLVSVQPKDSECVNR
jgi:hypothetical protein